MPLFYIQGVPVGYISIMLALLASMGGFIFGYDTGQISDIVLMDDFLVRFAHCKQRNVPSTCHFAIARLGLIVGLLSIGTLIGALSGAPVADFLGRRRAMTSYCMVFIAGIIVQLCSFHAWAQFAAGRLIAGLGVGALSSAVPMYQAETAPPQIRGTLTATYQLFITFGILTAYCISIGARSIPRSGSWRTVVGIGILWALILGIGILFMPESPRWLTINKRYPEARRALARVRGLSAEEADQNWKVHRELEDMRTQVEYEMQIRAGWIDCFEPKDKQLYRTILIMSLQMFQQLTGANYFFYYGATIFKGVGIPDSFVSQIILGAVNFGCTFLGLYVMEHFGRRWPLVIGGLWQSAWLFVFASAGTARDPVFDKGIGVLMIVSACLFILGFATTWAPGVWILTGETFPTRTRSKQAALAAASNWTWNFLLAFFTPIITNAIHFKYGYVFAGCNLAGALIVYFFLYESSDLSLEWVNEMYNDPTCKPWTSNKWAPPGFNSRYDLIQQVKAAEKGKPLEGAEEARIEKTGPDGNAPGGKGQDGPRADAGTGDAATRV